MATLAEWAGGTLPTTNGAGVTLVAGGGPAGYGWDAIQLAQQASEACSVRLGFTSRASAAIRGYYRTPAAWPASSAPQMMARKTSSIGGGRFNLAGSGQPGQARLWSADASASIAQSATGLLELSTWYRVELLINQAAGQARLGIFPLASAVAVYDTGWLAGNVDDAISIAEFGSALANPTVGTTRLAQLIVTDVIADWVGPAPGDTAVTRLDTPVLTVVAATSPSSAGASDGTATITWPPVPGAGRYQARANPGGTGWVDKASTVTSPYQVTGLPVGTSQLGVIAHPS